MSEEWWSIPPDGDTKGLLCVCARAGILRLCACLRGMILI